MMNRIPAVRWGRSLRFVLVALLAGWPLASTAQIPVPLADEPIPALIVFGGGAVAGDREVNRPGFPGGWFA